MNRIVIFSLAAAVLFGVVSAEGPQNGVDCSSVEGVTISIVPEDISLWNTSDQAQRNLWALNDKGGENSTCTPMFNQEGGVVSYGPFHVDDCADNATLVNGTFLEYRFEVNVPASSSDNSSLVNEADYRYVIRCLYNRNYTDVTTSFTPNQIVESSHSDEADLKIGFDLYRTNGDILINPGTTINLAEPFYGEIFIDSGNTSVDLNLNIKSVTALSDNVGSDQVALITDGCPENNGVVDGLVCDEDADESFFMKSKGAFRFPNQQKGDKVYLKATVIVCLKSDNSSECQCSSCGGETRKRRAVQDSHKMYYISAGPFRIANSDEESAVDKNEQVNEGSTLPSYVIAVLGVCGVVAVALICATVVIVLRRRPKASLTAESRDAEAKQVTSYEQELQPDNTDIFVL